VRKEQVVEDGHWLCTKQVGQPHDHLPSLLRFGKGNKYEQNIFLALGSIFYC
jgi:hypothetical protein